MTKYIIKRILQAIPLILIISIICFTLIQLAPYNAIDTMITPSMPQETANLIKARYGFDKPAYIQYFLWLKGIVQGEFGYSIITNQSISSDLLARIPATIKLILPSYIIAVVIAIILGLLSGSNKNKLVDKIIDGFCSIGIAVPSFWFAMIIIFIFGYKLGILPILGMNTIGAKNSFLDSLLHFIMPCSVLVMAYLPDLIRYVRSSTLTQISESYVMVQKSFGATKKEILFMQGEAIVNRILADANEKATAFITDADVKLYFRVGAVFNNAKIIVECDGKEILSKKKVKLCPGEMEYVTLKQSVISELPVNAEITVRVEA